MGFGLAGSRGLAIAAPAVVEVGSVSPSGGGLDDGRGVEGREETVGRGPVLVAAVAGLVIIALLHIGSRPGSLRAGGRRRQLRRRRVSQAGLDPRKVCAALAPPHLARLGRGGLVGGGSTGHGVLAARVRLVLAWSRGPRCRRILVAIAAGAFEKDETPLRVGFGSGQDDGMLLDVASTFRLFLGRDDRDRADVLLGERFRFVLNARGRREPSEPWEFEGSRYGPELGCLVRPCLRATAARPACQHGTSDYYRGGTAGGTYGRGLGTLMVVKWLSIGVAIMLDEVLQSFRCRGHPLRGDGGHIKDRSWVQGPVLWTRMLFPGDWQCSANRLSPSLSLFVCVSFSVSLSLSLSLAVCYVNNKKELPEEALLVVVRSGEGRKAETNKKSS